MSEYAHIKNNICINERLNNICNLGYACDGCPYNKEMKTNEKR